MPKTTPPAPLEPHWFQILLTLADRDLHGLAIMNDVLDRTGGRMRLWPGMLYRALGRLADIGLVTEIEPPDDAPIAGGRPRTARRIRCRGEAQEAAESLIGCRDHRPRSFGCFFAHIRGNSGCVSATRWRRPASRVSPASARGSAAWVFHTRGGG
jgi:hypothetical protein